MMDPGGSGWCPFGRTDDTCGVMQGDTSTVLYIVSEREYTQMDISCE